MTSFTLATVISLLLSLGALTATILLNNRSNNQSELVRLTERVANLEKKLADCEIREEHHLSQNLYLMRQITLAGLEHLIRHQTEVRQA